MSTPKINQRSKSPFCVRRFTMFHDILLITMMAMTIHGQQDNKYDILQSEVLALKKLVLNINTELEKLRKEHDEMGQHLKTLRSTRQPIETSPSMKLSEFGSYGEDNEDIKNVRNERATGYTPSFSLYSLWNGTQTIQIKGEKGDPGLRGPKGDTGTPGIKGQAGHNGTSGTTGSKGETGRAGFKGQKGENGIHGSTGPMGPKGDIGRPGTKGQKGDIGNTGPTGQKGDNGKAAQKISFCADTTLRNHTRFWNYVFEEVKWNDGNFYNSATGVFTCHVAGTYLFTLNVWSVSMGDAMFFFIMTDTERVRGLYVPVSNSIYNSGTITALVQLSQGESVFIDRPDGKENSYAMYQFEGVQLY